MAASEYLRRYGLNACPDSKGIKTQPLEVFAAGTRLNACPDSKGIKTARSGPIRARLQPERMP